MKIEITGIKTSAIIGCYDYEQQQPQDLVVDIVVELYQSNWLKPDSLETTVDYDSLIDFIKEEIAATNFHLLESLSQYLTAKIFERYLLIKNIQLKLTKPTICGNKAMIISVSYFDERKFKVALALGSNSNLPQQQIITAVEILGEYIFDIEIGNFYSTKPVGYVKQDNFVNTALVGYVAMRPEDLLGKIKSVEKLMGKEEVFHNGPRIIDIDLIFFDDLVYSHNFLKVPHKEAHKRDFVLRPLADIAPNWMHPLESQTVIELLAALPKEENSILQKLEYYKI